VITDKEKPCTPSLKEIDSAMKEIAISQSKRIVIVHGGGSFGHPTAKEYGLQKGYLNPSQIMGVAKTRQSMMELNKIVIDSGIKNGLPCVSISPSSFIQTESKRIVQIHTAVINDFLDLGSIPVLFGDVVTDKTTRFCILSGDQLTARLATEHRASKVILAVDVDGVYDADPKTNPQARLIPVLNSARARYLMSSRMTSGIGHDVTGGMIAKVGEMVPVVESGATVSFVNGLRPGLLLDALSGKKTMGTVMLR